MKKIYKHILKDTCAYFNEKVDKKPEFFNDICKVLEENVKVESFIEVDDKLIKDICDYCEKEAIYDKLGCYGDFYYQLARYFWV